MNRQIRTSTSFLMCTLILLSGCHPKQPFYFGQDEQLSHYLDVATDIEYPDVCQEPLSEVQYTQTPLTVSNTENFEMWDISLQEVIRITLENSQVLRQLGGRISDGGQNIAATAPEILTQNPGAVVTTYDPALVESGNGTGTGSNLSGTGVEAALAEFDAVLDSSLFWQKNDRPQNFRGVGSAFFANQFQQDLSNFTLGITKNTGNGSTFELRNNTNYDLNNNPSRSQPSDWITNIEAAVVQPLLQGAGTQYNRIAGPQTFQQYSAGFSNPIDGVMIARIRQDTTLTDFEAGVRDMMKDVENAYWELYFAYRDLEARKIGRNSSLETWKKVQALQRVGQQGGEADKEAQSRSQYYLFKSQVETALTTLFRVENRLRYLMGIRPTDGRLIRPIDEPTTAVVEFDWASIHGEALARRAELRKQKWQIKRRELELIAARNHMLPRLDAVGRYRWLGAGDKLINSTPNGIPPFGDGSNAWESLTSGNYQEWEMGVQLNIPIGFRLAMTGIRHHQLLLARERSVLQDMELAVSHQLSDSKRDVDLNYTLALSNFNRRVAAEDEVEAVEAIYDSGRVTLDLLLEAQRRRADSESLYYRSLVDYNRAIMLVHYRKGSLLEYNNVFLAEGPWPGKAYFDALRLSRQRSASRPLDYGFTRPNVVSQGPAQLRTTPITGSPELEPTLEDFQIQEEPIPYDSADAPFNPLEATESEVTQIAEPHEIYPTNHQGLPTDQGPTGHLNANGVQPMNQAAALPQRTEIPPLQTAGAASEMPLSNQSVPVQSIPFQQAPVNPFTPEPEVLPQVMDVTFTD